MENHLRYGRLRRVKIEIVRVESAVNLEVSAFDVSSVLFEQLLCYSLVLDVMQVNHLQIDLALLRPLMRRGKTQQTF